MKERPILFSGPMVRALLAGTKTQTRRVVKAARDPNIGCWMSPGEIALDSSTVQEFTSPYGKPGDRLWVREAWRTTGDDGRCDDMPPRDLQAHPVWHEANGWAPPDECAGKLRPSMFMPRWASRLTLEVTGVRVERLQDINEADARAEGLIPARGPLGSQMWEYSERTGGQFSDPRVAFRMLWESINGPGSWDANPWVWVIDFKPTDNPKTAL